MALGLFTATAGTGSGFLLMNLFFFQLNFELLKCLIVSMCAVTIHDRVFPHYVPNSSIKHSKSDSKDRSQEIL
jgi:hypothetical protein